MGLAAYIKGSRNLISTAAVEFRKSFKENDHRPLDLFVSITAALLLVAMSRIILHEELPQWEITAFRSVNNLPDWLFPVIWPFMQYGVFVTIPVVAAIAFYFKRYRLAVLLLIGGIGIYYMARFVKEIVPRGRPEALLSNVNAREYFAPWSSGFTSGHTAVAATIATFAHHYLSRKWQMLSIFTLCMVVIGRVYVGGHLPLDVFGGVALGIAVASLINFIVGVPEKQLNKKDTKEWVRLHRPHHPGDVIRMGLAGIVFIVTTIFALTGLVGPLEESAFRFINSLPAFLSPLIQLIMQGGAIFFVFIAAGAALIFKHYRLSVKILFGGTLVWWLARIAKELVQRDRPFFLLQDIVDRAGASGLGFPSGHASVAALLATVVAPYITKKWSRVLWAGAIIVAIGRVYVGAHLPLDVLAGLSMGWFFGSALNFGFGTPPKPTPIEKIKAVLNEGGLAVTKIVAAKVDARGSTPLMAEAKRGKKLFIKLLDAEHRNADILYRLWRYITLKTVEDEAPFATPKQLAEHEAYLSIQASQSEVQNPKVLFAAPVTSSSAMIVTERIDAEVLSEYKGAINQKLLESIWQEVAKLHKQRIAHRDLRASNIMIDKSRRPWLIDFSFASTAASSTLLAQDIVELIVSTAILTSPKSAVRAAVKVMGNNAISKALPYVQYASLTSNTRNRLGRKPNDYLEMIFKEMREQTNSGPVKRERISRLNLQWLFLLIFTGLAIYFLLPQLDELDKSVETIKSADILWLAAAAAASVGTYMAAALTVLGSTFKHLSYGSTLLLQAATTAVNRVTPKGIGGIALTEQYLEKHGLNRVEASTAVSLIYGSGIIVHIMLLGLSLLIVDLPVLDIGSYTSQQISLVIGIAVFIVAGLILAPRLSPRFAHFRKEFAASFSTVVKQPIKLLQLIGGSAGITLMYTLAMYFCIEAFGAGLSFETVMLVYLGGNAIASAAPTPGGLGAAEAAWAVGFTAFGLSLGLSVTAVLAFRLITFWLPILPGLWAFNRLNKKIFGNS